MGGGANDDDDDDDDDNSADAVTLEALVKVYPRRASFFLSFPFFFFPIL